MSFEGISAVDRILKEYVGVSRFKLKLSQRGEKLAGLDSRMRNSRIGNPVSYTHLTLPTTPYV